MDVTSLYTNIPQEVGLAIVCNAYEVFHKNNPPIPTALLKEMLGLILKENSFQFNGRNYLQTHGTAMGTKMAVAFANIFMSAVETAILSQSNTKPLEWKRYIDDVFSLWDTNREEIDKFIEHANRQHATIEFTAEISDNETTFLDTCVYKGERLKKERCAHTSNRLRHFQYTHYSSCHPPGVSKGFIKGEALRLLRTNSSKTTFEENIRNFRVRLRMIGYPRHLVDHILSEVKFTERESALQQRQKTQNKPLPFVTQYHPSVPDLKRIFMG